MLLVSSVANSLLYLVAGISFEILPFHLLLLQFETAAQFKASKISPNSMIFVDSVVFAQIHQALPLNYHRLVNHPHFVRQLFANLP